MHADNHMYIYIYIYIYIHNKMSQAEGKRN